MAQPLSCSYFLDRRSVIFSTFDYFVYLKFCLLKKSISEINSNTDATDNSITETTHLLRKHIEFLLQENASKNTIIKILAKNQQHASNTKEVVSSEPFKTVKGNFIKNRYKPKSQNVVCSNRYDTLYPTERCLQQSI